jgi:Zn-dependent protease
VIGRKGRAVVAAGPVQVDPPQVALRQLRTPLRERRPPSANACIVQEPLPAPATVHEGEYEPPPGKPAPDNRWKGIGTGAVGLGLLFAKFKGALLLLLNLKWFLVGSKLLLSSFTFFASVWLYALFWGWKFGLIFTLLILVHELGHLLFMKFYGVPGSLPFFIPGLGAFVKYDGGVRPGPLQEAYIALGGPLCGSLGAFACLLYGQASGDNLWIAAAYTGFFLNLFNLLPVLPFDGGRVTAAVSPRVWLFGLVALIVAALAFHWWNPLILILVLFSAPQAIAAWRGRAQPQESPLSPLQRGGVAAAYFALAGFLFAAMLVSHVANPNLARPV